MGGAGPAREPGHVLNDGYGSADLDRAVAVVSAERSPRALVEQLGIDWDYLAWLALDASAAVLREQAEERGDVVAFAGEAFTAGFLIGVHLPRRPPPAPERLGEAVDLVQVRGRHAVIAHHCDLSGVAHLETVYTEALVESIEVVGADRDALRSPVTRIFEAGLAVGLELASGDGRDGPAAQEP